MMSEIPKLLFDADNSFYHDNIVSILVNQNWLLVNKIKEEKTTYVFSKDNVLTRTTNGTISKAKWHYVNENYIRITGEDGSINVIKMTFRNEDILTLDIDRKSNELAVFINETKSDKILNTYDDITTYLHAKYLSKAKNIIQNHLYYFINKSEEFGPFTAKELINKVKKGILSSQCFIRETNESNYNKRLRIKDLISVI
ncbi:hypothetical protein [Lacinutrix sp. MedPE-SW]|uniref:hypothetical protein n=1 Tax=Lacinutrix sp. MedPE-SW TaxID=1860087 RepID=UPI00091099AE|nr:hypothetical protein [Lacinutrix sp. MedPE-SW]OIQ24030.1 MAG: hypothetical protein BM549_01600 [Lacinutrix sp. MedPE-SW]